MKRFGAGALGLLALVVVGVFGAWVTSPDPKFNPATFEDAPLVEAVAPLGQAITLAQYTNDTGAVKTLLVTGFDEANVTGVDVTLLGGTQSPNPFEAVAELANLPDSLEGLSQYPETRLAPIALLPSGSPGYQHIGTGTNFPEHAEEAGSPSVFSFPKFGKATPARTIVAAPVGILLDYEVELCMRFDRDITSIEDFDAAVKGVFLCGDFTNRNALIQLADPDNLDSGSGFSDSKSGPGHFPTGPFLVIPKDWKAFVADIRMTTSLNSDPRQDARGGEMTLDFRDLVVKALGDMAQPRFLYKHDYTFLAPDAAINASMTLMSGTSEGVIFTSPTRGDIIAGVASYLASGGPLSGQGLMDVAKEAYIESELATEHFLQPGDRVRHGSSYLGNIEVDVVAVD
ncbi:MAG: fumarylacetoacetate hydrolase family protein [Pseudomonadota bacterium]